MSKAYWLIIVAWVILFVSFLLVNHLCIELSNDSANLVLGGIAVMISIISLGIANKSKPSFNGVIKCWSLETEIQPDGEGKPKFQQINFEIINSTAVPIKDLVVNFRIPKKIFFQNNNNQGVYSFFEYGETIILTSNMLSFLGTNNGDNHITFEHYINYRDWKKSNIYITISGSNILPKSTEINQKDKSKILLHSINNKLIVNKKS